MPTKSKNNSKSSKHSKGKGSTKAIDTQASEPVEPTVLKASTVSIDEDAKEIKPLSPTAGIASLAGSISSLLKAISEKHLTTIVLAYTKRVEEKQKGVAQQALIDIWNEVVPEYVIKLTAQAKPVESTTVEGKICDYYYPKAKKACECEVSLNSKSGRFCSKHIKQEDKKTQSPSPKEDKAQCEYVPSKGDHANERCENCVSAKSATGKFCGKHIKSGEKVTAKTAKKAPVASEGLTLHPKLNRALDIYVDAATNLALERSTKKIYARVDGDKILPLRDEDKALLDKHNYEYDTQIYNTKHKAKVSVDVKDEDDDAEIEEDDE